MNLHPVDAVVLVVYLIGITLLGSWTARKISSAADYFMPRRFGKASDDHARFRDGDSVGPGRDGGIGDGKERAIGDLVPVDVALLDAVLLADCSDHAPFSGDHNGRRIPASLRPKRSDALSRLLESQEWPSRSG